jgi:hypothetical protein
VNEPIGNGKSIVLFTHKAGTPADVQGTLDCMVATIADKIEQKAQEAMKALAAGSKGGNFCLISLVGPSLDAFQSLVYEGLPKFDFADKTLACPWLACCKKYCYRKEASQTAFPGMTQLILAKDSNLHVILINLILFCQKCPEFKPGDQVLQVLERAFTVEVDKNQGKKVVKANAVVLPENVVNHVYLQSNQTIYVPFGTLAIIIAASDVGMALVFPLLSKKDGKAAASTLPPNVLKYIITGFCEHLETNKDKQPWSGIVHPFLVMCKEMGFAQFIPSSLLSPEEQSKGTAPLANS